MLDRRGVRFGGGRRGSGGSRFGWDEDVAGAQGHALDIDELLKEILDAGLIEINPLVVQGPGAGPQVTAAGVFGDILAIAHSLSDGIGLHA